MLLLLLDLLPLKYELLLKHLDNIRVRHFGVANFVVSLERKSSSDTMY